MIKTTLAKFTRNAVSVCLTAATPLALSLPLSACLVFSDGESVSLHGDSNDSGHSSDDGTVNTGPIINNVADKYDFGQLFDGTSSNTMIQITNSGSERLTGVSFAWFSDSTQVYWDGGSFPGTGGDCDDDLNPGETCLFDIVFNASSHGGLDTYLNIDYYDPNSNFHNHKIEFDGSVRGASAELDTSFGTAGDGYTANIQYMSDDFFAKKVLLDSLDRIYVLGNVSIPGAGNDRFAILRLTENGEVDTTFGNLGWAIHTPSTGTDVVPKDFEIDTSGKILVTGAFPEVSTADLYAVRFNADGNGLDPSFASAGVLRYDLNTAAPPIDISNQVEILSDGKFLLSGYAQVGGVLQYVVARFLADGSGLDVSFGSSSGYEVEGIYGITRSAAMAVDEVGGTIYLGGTSNNDRVSSASFSLNGSPINTRHEQMGGAVPLDHYYTAAVMNSGDVVFGGMEDNDLTGLVKGYTLGMANSFGAGAGVTFVTLKTIHSMHVYANDSILAAGISGSAPTYAGLVKLNAAGGTITAFGGGEINYDFNSPPPGAVGVSIAIRSDGRIIYLAGTSPGGVAGHFAVARIWD